jgi:hypothetical protein
MNCYTSFPMLRTRQLIGVLSLIVGLAACGGSLSPNDAGTGAGGTAAGGAGGTTGQAGTTGQGGTTGACATLSGCDCLAASPRCAARSEACWCPTECFPGGAIDCVCGGGRFLACEDRKVADCSNQLAAVQAKCAGQAFVEYIGSLCVQTGADPSCTASCLAKLNATGSCSEIDCSFCPVCDCAPAQQASTFAACLSGCSQPSDGL